MKHLFSMKTTGVLILIFAFSIALATFIENDYGTLSAKAVIYNARWFEFLLLLLGISIFINIFTYKLYRKEKIPMLLLHIAFVVILVGAALTRYVGYEGMMHIREGESADYILSRETFLQVEAYGEGQRLIYRRPLLLSSLVDQEIEESFTLGKQEVGFHLSGFKLRAFQTLEESAEGVPMISVVGAVQDSQGRENYLLKSGEHRLVGQTVLTFNQPLESPNAVNITQDSAGLSVRSSQPIRYMVMSDGSQGELEADVVHPFQSGRLYQVGATSLVLQKYLEKGRVLYESATKQSGKGLPDLLTIDLQVGKEKKPIEVFGQEGVLARMQEFSVGDVRFKIGYGARKIELPFAVFLRDFQLERYPGSMSPSSYASEVTLLDGNGEQRYDYRIFMNHILEHEGYRFYQSSYDSDEKGTILSVNHDHYGTLVTYAGYIMLALGMFLSLIARSGRMRNLFRKLDALQSRHVGAAVVAALIMVGGADHANAAEPTSDDQIKELARTLSSIDPQHAEAFGRLIIQDRGGRMKPVDTLSKEILNKVARKNSLFGLSSNQILLGMLTRPNAWQSVKMIKVSNPEVKKLIGINEGSKHAAFSDFFVMGEKGKYKLAEKVSTASRKRPAEQNRLDKELIKVDERVNICYMVFTGMLLDIIPKPGDENAKWFSPITAMEEFPEQESLKVRQMLHGYFGALDQGIEQGQWQEADKILQEIVEYQKFYGAAVIPDESRVNMEIFYNRLQIFERLFPLYLLAGLLLMILSVTHIVRPFFSLSKVTWVLGGIMFVGFVLHTVGLGVRWYISGHAPWSDGYESMIYIAWTAVLAGFLFVRSSPVALAATGILAGVTLFSAHLSWMDPQITNIVPVLNSYWLVIHVSMITASYGFLGLGALLGFVVLLLMIFKREATRKETERAIMELSHINEMVLLGGLALLTVGNFLGGVWANESWGRYWGWDPKETWALVSILVYAFVLHMRFIPAMRGIYAFNVASVIAFSSVLMTYFGVNFYLSGLHSYAQGDPVPIPTFVYVSALVVAGVVTLAYFKRKFLVTEK